MNKIIILGVVLLSLTSVFAGDYAAGNITVDGSDFDNAIPIADTTDLIHLSQTPGDWGKFFVQTADIIFADSTLQDWNADGVTDGSGTSGFTPIGSEANPFSGSYDGGGYEIDKLYINRIGEADYLSALFGYLTSVDGDSVVIKNLGIGKNSVVINSQSGSGVVSYAGGIVAYSIANLVIDSCYNSGSVTSTSSYISKGGGLVGCSCSTLTITNSYNSGSVTSTSSDTFVGGGLVGSSSTLIITNSYNSGSVTCSSSSYVGGLVGLSSSTLIITNSYNSGSVTCFSSSSSSYVGGLVGFSSPTSTITNSYNSGSVTSTSYIAMVGGLVGSSSTLIITNSYNSGSVTSFPLFFSYVGGLVGSYSTLTITNSYNSGSVTSFSSSSSYFYVGGLVGASSTLIITNCYFDYQTTGLSTNASVGNDDSYIGNGLSTDNFKDKSSYDESWFVETPNIDNPWVFKADGRPYLYWQTVALSNSIISDGEINISIVDVQADDGISIVSTGLRYSPTDSIVFTETEDLSGSFLIDGLTIDSVYYVQPYVLLSNGSYSYGDMFKYTAIATSETITLEDDTAPILTTQKLSFTPHVVQVYSLKGELVKSEYCNSLSDYNQLIQGLAVNQRYVIK